MINVGGANLITLMKQPNEVLPVDISFGKLHILPSGATEISEVEASAVKWKRKFPDTVEAANDFLVTQTPAILEPSKTSVRVTLTGGTDGYDYKVTILATFDNNAVLEQEIFVRVRED